MNKTPPSVFAVIQNNEGFILMVKKSYGKQDWTCPGGFMEAGETPEESIHREILEESNCNVTQLQFRHIYSVPSRSDVILTFRGVIDTINDWQSNEEITERGFFDLNNLPKPVTKETLRKITDALSAQETQLFNLHKDAL